MSAPINVDHIIDVFNRHHVEYLVIGGMNFLLRHKGRMTYDIDLWINDTAENRQRCESALAELNAEWGAGDDDWGLTANKPAGWLERQGMFCMNSTSGAIDIFRFVDGLSDWNESYRNSVSEQTSHGSKYQGISDADMLKCQYAIAPPARKSDRVSLLEEKLQKGPDEHGQQ